MKIERKKMMVKTVSRCSLLLFVACALVSRTTGTTVTKNLRPDNHRVAVSNRDSWPSWFQHRQESITNDRSTSIEKITRAHTDRYRTRHEIATRSRAHTNVQSLHDVLMRNLRTRKNNNKNDVESFGSKNFYDFRGYGSSSKSDETTTAKRTREKSNSDARDSRNEPTDLTESKTLRPTTPTTKTTTTTTTKTTTTSQDSSVEDKSEKLTAIVVAEHTGTRAVAYAGYHHHNHDYNPSRTRDTLTPGYEILATSAIPIYTKYHTGRRVCNRPTSMAHHHRSRQYRVVYTELSSSTFVCCPGWSQVSRTSYGCNRPTCAAPCLNGGVCGPHGKCNCPKAFTGTQCQTDIDECVTEKPCGQLCTNLPGSYECHCRYGFHLLPDGQSCRKNGSDGTAFEARDLENDYGYTTSTTPETIRRTTPASHDIENEVGDRNADQDYDIILRRLEKLEKQIARSRKRDSESTEMAAKISQAVESVAAMRRAVDNVQLMQQEIYDMRGKVKQFELESRKLQHLTNRVADLETRLRLRCRSSING